MGKKMKAALTKMEPRPYALREAVAVVKSAAYAKFDESVDLAIRLGVDPKRSDQMVRGPRLFLMARQEGTGDRLCEGGKGTGSAPGWCGFRRRR